MFAGEIDKCVNGARLVALAIDEVYTHVSPYGTFSLNLAERLALDSEEVAV